MGASGVEELACMSLFLVDAICELQSKRLRPARVLGLGVCGFQRQLLRGAELKCGKVRRDHLRAFNSDFHPWNRQLEHVKTQSIYLIYKSSRIERSYDDWYSSVQKFR